MSCEHPLLAVNLGKVDGKYKIKILGGTEWNVRKAEERFGYDNLLLLPCGRCPGCKANHQREWAVRCTLESSYYKENCMITLTYAEGRCPKKLVKRDLQDFIKSMRNKGLHFRYFACGEYGQKHISLDHPYGRPHYHIIMFGYWPKDAQYDFMSEAGFPVYTSKFVSSVWKNGIVAISEMSPGTAAYTAGYVDKKLGQGEFSLMSKRPGIGERYFREHLFDIYAYDNLVGSFGIAKVPRYCDKVADYAWMDIDDIKEKRKEASNGNIISVMNDHSLNYKDEAVGFNARMQRDKLQRKKRHDFETKKKIFPS